MLKKLAVILLAFMFIFQSTTPITVSADEGSHSAIASMSATETSVEIGGTLRYQVTVNNPNENVALEDLLVVNPIDSNLVAFVPGSVRINGATVAPPNYSFTNGVLRVYLPTLPAGAAYVISFEVTVLTGAETISQIARLYGPIGAEGEERSFISSVNATVVVVDDGGDNGNGGDDPCPTEPTDEDPCPTDPEPTEPPIEEDPCPTEPTDEDPCPTDPEPTEPPIEDPCPTEPTDEDPCPTEPTDDEGSPIETTVPPSHSTPSPSTPNNGGGVLPQTGAALNFALAGASTSFITAGAVLVRKGKRK